MRILDDLKLGRKLLLMLALPLIGVLWLSVTATVMRYQAFDEAGRFSRATSLAVAIVDLARAVQDARRTGDVAASASAWQVLESARARARPAGLDAELPALFEALSQHRSEARDGTMLDAVDALLARLQLQGDSAADAAALAALAELTRLRGHVVVEGAVLGMDARLARLRHLAGAQLSTSLLDELAQGLRGGGLVSTLTTIDAAQRMLADGMLADAQARRQRESGLLLLMLVLVVGGFGVTLWLVLAFTGGISRRVGEVRAALADFSNGHHERRIKAGGRDEIGDIGESFNRMARQTQEALEAERLRHAREQSEAQRFRQALDEVNTVLSRIAFGDLRHTLNVSSGAGLESLEHHVNLMVGGLRALTHEMIEATGHISVSVSELQSNASDQAAAAMQQASAANETTTTLEEIRIISTQMRDKAQRLGGTADRALAESEEGRERIADSVAGMGLIRDRVERIGTRVNALSDQAARIESINAAVANLARQSRMLAVNAAVEAAKAGAAGRGFAVVAREVKSLAEQSAQETLRVDRALRETRQMIGDVVHAVEQGAIEIVQALQSVEGIRGALSSLSEVAHDTAVGSKQIVSSVQQVSTGVDQLAVAVAEIGQATRQFTETSRRMENAAHDLGGIVATLRDHAGVYDV